MATNTTKAASQRGNDNRGDRALPMPENSKTPNRTTVKAVTELLGADKANELRSHALQNLYPFIDESNDDNGPKPEALLRAALNRRDLTEKQREALRNIRGELAAARADALADMADLYERTVSPGRYHDEYRAWLVWLAQRFDKRETEYVDPTERIHQTFQEAVEDWHEQLQLFEDLVFQVTDR